MAYLTALEKIWIVLVKIDDQFNLTPKGTPIKLSMRQKPLSLLNPDEVSQIMDLLQYDDGAIEIKQKPKSSSNGYYYDEFYRISLSIKFFMVMSKYRDKVGASKGNSSNFVPSSGTKEESGPTILQPIQDVKKAQLSRESKYWITYNTDDRQVILNDLFVLATPDYDSENERFFSYVFQNPNKRLTRLQIEEAIGEPLKKSISDILKDLGFNKGLRKAFFNASNTSVEFNPQVTYEDAQKRQLELLKIS